MASVKGEVVIGFYAKRSYDVVNSDVCGVQDEVSDKVRKIVREFIVENKISVYDEVE